MIKVVKDFNPVPFSINYSEHKLKISNLLKSKDSKTIKGYDGDDVKKELHNVYHSKCAYCESKQTYAILHIEHYRPKKEVKDINNQLIQNHVGYYWLAFEWSNLMLSCPDCNSQKAKGNRFPIQNEADRISVPPVRKSDWKSNSEQMINEKPLLLNPEIDNPNEHLEFNFDGTLKGVTVRGLATIEICKLNRKAKENYEPRLAERRKKKIDEMILELKKIAKRSIEKMENNPEINLTALFYDFHEIFTKIKFRQNPENEFSLLYSFIFQNFNKFLEYMDMPRMHKLLIINAFQNFSK